MTARNVAPAVMIVREIAARAGPVDVAILFSGGVQLANRFDGAYLTLSADRAAQATLIPEARLAIPAHFEGWTHFTQGADQLRAAFAGHGIGDRVLLPTRGHSVVVARDDR